MNETFLRSARIALLVALGARGIHQNAPHEARGHREEVHAILPLDLLDFDQPEIRLVDERRGLKRMPDAFVAHVAPRDTAQFLMDERQQLIERGLLTSAPGLQ